MPSAAALRLQIETALQSRVPGALTPRPRILRELAATGVPELDLLLEGGLPIGAISECVGPLCSGRTTLAMTVLAEMTQAGKTVAWVDAADALDPESAAAAGIDLKRQLWVRCGQSTSAATQRTGVPLQDHATPALLVEGSRTPAPSGGGGSPHPRSEVHGLPQAIDALFQPDIFSRPAPPRDPTVPRKNRMVGTPSAPNRKLLDRTPQDPRPLPRRAMDREEQIPTDRQPSRREANFKLPDRPPKNLAASQIAYTGAVAGAWTDNRNNAAGRSLHTAPNAIAAGLPRFREMEARASGQGHGAEQGPLQWKPSLQNLQKLPRRTETEASPPSHETSLAGSKPKSLGRSASPVWQALDQALRATDLLLAAGGFSAIVLDLGSTPADFAWRIPLATWFRFRAAADRAQTVLLVLTQHPCARSSAELVLRFDPAEPQIATTVLTGAYFRVTVDRRRFETPTTHGCTPDESPSANTLHLVSPRKAPQRERSTLWHRHAAWTGTTPGDPK